jgi:hypothetical protein
MTGNHCESYYWEHIFGDCVYCEDTDALFCIEAYVFIVVSILHSVPGANRRARRCGLGKIARP